MNGFRERRRGDFDGQAMTGASRRHGHDPVPSEIDVDGVPMAVDRCRDCGIVVLDPGQPGGPCPGPNHTLTEFGVTPLAERDREAEPPAGRLARGNRQGRADRHRATTTVLASR